MKRDGLSFAARLSAWFALVVIGLSVALFLAAYFLLYRAVQEQDREVVVRAQLEVYRAWYAEGGLPALNTRFREREDSGKELFFVRVIGPQRTALFVSVPKQAGDLDLSPLENMTQDEALAWLTLPARNRGDGWLVATARLPDGGWLQVGKTTEALTALLTEFRTIFGWVALIALVLGLAGGAWLTRRALAPDPPAHRGGAERHHDRAHERAHAAAGGERRDRPPRAALQHHAGEERHADPRHARGAGQRRPRPAHAADTPARHRRTRARGRARRRGNAATRSSTRWRKPTACSRCSTR